MALAAETVCNWNNHRRERQDPAWAQFQSRTAAATKSSRECGMDIVGKTSISGILQSKAHHAVTRHPSVLKLPSVRSDNKRSFSDVHPLPSRRNLSPLPSLPASPALSLLNRFATEFVSTKGFKAHQRPWFPQDVLVILEESCTFVLPDTPPDMRINPGRKAKSSSLETTYNVHGNNLIRNPVRHDDMKIVAQSSHPAASAINGAGSTKPRTRTTKSLPEVISSSTQYAQISHSSAAQTNKSQNEIVYHEDSTCKEKCPHGFPKQNRSRKTRDDSASSVYMKTSGQQEQKAAPVNLLMPNMEHSNPNSNKTPTSKSSHDGSTSCVANEGSSQASSSKRPGRSNGERSRRTNRKRTRSEKDGRNEGNAGSDENDRGRIENNDTGLGSPAHDRLACPHYAHDCERYCRCHGLEYKSCYQGFSNMTRLVEHLERVHCIPIRCERCLTQFESSEGLKEHWRLKDSCLLKPENSDDVISQRQLGEIKRVTRQKGTEEGKWRRIFKIIYPSTKDEDVPSPWVRCPGHRQRKMEDAITKRRNDLLHIVDTLFPDRVDTKQQLRLSIKKACTELMEANSGKRHPEDLEVSQIVEPSKDITPMSNQASEPQVGQMDTSLETLHTPYYQPGTLNPRQLDLGRHGCYPSSWTIPPFTYPSSTASFDPTEAESADYTLEDTSTMDDIVATPRSHQSLRSYGLKSPHRQIPPGLSHDGGSGIPYLEADSQGNTTFVSDTTDEGEFVREPRGEAAEERLPQVVKDSQEQLGFHGLAVDPHIELIDSTPGFDDTGLTCSQHGRIFSMCTETCTGHIGVFAALGSTRAAPSPRPTN